MASANDTISLGFIGVGGRGFALLEEFSREPDVRVAAACDVDQHHLKIALRAAPRAEGHGDFRKLLERKDLDGVVVATPDHWHAIPMIHACQAGKDVYIEKPLCARIAEGRKMVEAAARYGRVVQMGTQIHAGRNYRRVAEIVQSGVLGKISLCRAWISGNHFPGMIGRAQDSDPPPGLDWEMWLGPAPRRAYRKNRAHYHFRWFWDYAGGRLSDMGCHLLDLVLWATGARAPRSAVATGGKLVLDDDTETPDTLEVAYDFPEGFTLVWSNTEATSKSFDGHRDLGISFHGTNGTLISDYDSHEIHASGERLQGVALPAPAAAPPRSHVREFLDCMRSRAQPSCAIEYAHRLTTCVLLGNVSYRAGRAVRWDAEREEVIGDREASLLLTREYRAPWTV